jgi:hypothetical protein
MVYKTFLAIANLKAPQGAGISCRFRTTVKYIPGAV